MVYPDIGPLYSIAACRLRRALARVEQANATDEQAKATDEPWTWKDTAEFDRMQFFPSHAPESARRELGLQSGDLVLDIGSGLGGAGRYLSQKYGIKVIGIEMLEELHELADDLNRKNGCVPLPNNSLTFPTGSYLGNFLEGPPLADVTNLRPFNLPDLPDHIMSFLCFLHLPESDRVPAFRKAASLLKPGGKIYIEDFYIHGVIGEYEASRLGRATGCRYLPTKTKYFEQLVDGGFKNIQFEDVTLKWKEFAEMRYNNFLRNQPNMAPDDPDRTYYDLLGQFYLAMCMPFGNSYAKPPQRWLGRCRIIAEVDGDETTEQGKAAEKSEVSAKGKGKENERGNAPKPKPEVSKKGGPTPKPAVSATVPTSFTRLDGNLATEQGKQGKTTSSELSLGDGNSTKARLEEARRMFEETMDRKRRSIEVDKAIRWSQMQQIRNLADNVESAQRANTKSTETIMRSLENIRVFMGGPKAGNQVIGAPPEENPPPSASDFKDSPEDQNHQVSRPVEEVEQREEAPGLEEDKPDDDPAHDDALYDSPQEDESESKGVPDADLRYNISFMQYPFDDEQRFLSMSHGMDAKTDGKTLQDFLTRIETNQRKDEVIQDFFKEILAEKMEEAALHYLTDSTIAEASEDSGDDDHPVKDKDDTSLKNRQGTGDAEGPQKDESCEHHDIPEDHDAAQDDHQPSHDEPSGRDKVQHRDVHQCIFPQDNPQHHIRQNWEVLRAKIERKYDPFAFTFDHHPMHASEVMNNNNPLFRPMNHDLETDTYEEKVLHCLATTSQTGETKEAGQLENKEETSEILDEDDWAGRGVDWYPAKYQGKLGLNLDEDFAEYDDEVIEKYIHTTDLQCGQGHPLGLGGSVVESVLEPLVHPAVDPVASPFPILDDDTGALERQPTQNPSLSTPCDGSDGFSSDQQCTPSSSSESSSSRTSSKGKEKETTAPDAAEIEALAWLGNTLSEYERTETNRSPYDKDMHNSEEATLEQPLDTIAKGSSDVSVFSIDAVDEKCKTTLENIGGLMIFWKVWKDWLANRGPTEHCSALAESAHELRDMAEPAILQHLQSIGLQDVDVLHPRKWWDKPMESYLAAVKQRFIMDQEARQMVVDNVLKDGPLTPMEFWMPIVKQKAAKEEGDILPDTSQHEKEVETARYLTQTEEAILAIVKNNPKARFGPDAPDQVRTAIGHAINKHGVSRAAIWEVLCDLQENGVPIPDALRLRYGIPGRDSDMPVSAQLVTEITETEGAAEVAGKDAGEFVQKRRLKGAARKKKAKKAKMVCGRRVAR